MNEALKYFYEPILKTFDYKGRATRAQYWTWLGITIAVLLGLHLVIWNGNWFWSLFPNLGLAGSIGLVILLNCVAPIPMFSMTLRRLRQAGRGGLGAAYALYVGTGLLLLGVVTQFAPGSFINAVGPVFFILAFIGFLVFFFSAIACVILATLPDSTTPANT